MRALRAAQQRAPVRSARLREWQIGWAPAIAIIAALTAAPSAAAAESVLQLDSRPGVKEVLVVTPGKSAIALTPSLSKAANVVIVLNGDGGEISIGRSPDGPTGNFRIAGSMPTVERQALADKVGAVAILAPPSDRPVMDPAWRDGKAHVADIAAAMIVVLQRFPGAKVWLLGLSSGARSAAHAGAALQDKLAGVILMSVSQDAFSTGGFGDIRIPVLVVQHRRDSCVPYASIEAQSKWHTLVTVEDARLPKPGRSQDCGSESAHNFHGSEAQVIAAVAQWINTGTAPAEVDVEKEKGKEKAKRSTQ